ncbi:MAG: hypothetical protein CVU00_04010 [Bacteroidetes bacterium HGW-Bacteroidetes-17]|nr:MAG: hypothetical protein CVU00_04010 [Bacteroidetes bacterium HGW-Bacteroidetes-17]
MDSVNKLEILFEKYEKIIPYIIIPIILIAFNLEAIFGLDSLLLDDQARYSSALQHNLPWLKWSNFEISAYFRYPFWMLLTLSPELARGLVVLVWLLPIAYLAYYLFNGMFGLPKTISIAAAILPMILPGQTLIPAFIDGIYMLPGLLFLLISIITGMKSIQSTSKSWILIFVSVVSFYIAIETTELVVFSVFPFILLMFYISNFGKKLWVLIVPLILISGYRLVEVILYPRSASTPVDLTWEQIVTRLKISIVYVNPFGISNESFVGVLTIILVVLAIFLSVIWNRKKNNFVRLNTFNPIQNIIKPYPFLIIFSILWIVSLSFPFIFFSKYFPSRYLFFAGFGVSLIISLALYSSFYSLFKKSRVILFVLFAVLIINSGVHRINALKKFFYPFNNYHAIFTKELSAYSFPLNSQIVITGRSALPTGGYWIWSSGMLQYILKRKDITGIMPYEYQYYNPFNENKGRTYNTKMTGLNLDFPIFFFKHQNTFKQYSYALQWLNEDLSESPWKLFLFDLKTGLPISLAKGNGYQDYLFILDSLKMNSVKQEEIMFGGEPSKKDSLRLKI